MIRIWPNDSISSIWFTTSVCEVIIRDHIIGCKIELIVG